MIIFFTIYKKYLFYILSFIFFLLHLSTITSSALPWIDEVMFIDLPVNLFQNGDFSTTAYAAKNGVTPFPTYPPLYSFIIFIWINIFNFSILSVRSFNLFLILISSFLGLELLKKYKISNFLKLNFLILFWLSNNFIWIFKNGRVDVLNLFLCSVYIISITQYNLKSFTKIILTALIIISGIQASLYVFLFLIWFYIFKFGNKIRFLSEIYIYIYGTSIGFILMTIFFYLNNSTIPFLSFIFSSAPGIKQILIYLIDLIGFKKFEINTTQIVSSKFEIYNSLKQNSDFLVLFIMNILYLIILILKNKIKINSLEIKVLIFILFVTFIFSLSGHFIIYYTWMIYIPVVILFLILSNNLFFKYTSILVVFYLSYNGINEQFIKSSISKDIIDINIFLKKNIKEKNPLVFATFSSYYSIKKITNKVYFPGIYPIELLPKNPNYIIYSELEFGSSNLKELLIRYNNSYQIKLIDSLIKPKIFLYKIN